MWVRIENQAEAAAVINLLNINPKLSKLVERINNAQADELNQETAALIETARELYEDNDCDLEIDDDAAVLPSEENHWVMAWVYVQDVDVTTVDQNNKERKTV